MSGHGNTLGARLLGLSLLAACGGNTGDGKAHTGFGEGFLIGTAIAGFQAEMGCPTLAPERCEDRGSDWHQFITDERTTGSRGTFLAGQPPTAGPGHYELYEADLDLAAEGLASTAFRTSIEWSRLFPNATDDVADDELIDVADPAALTWYRRYFEAIRSRGMTPVITLNHYSLPLWIHDGAACHVDIEGCTPRGWVDRERTVREIARYAGFAAAQFGDLVDDWATLNEPIVVLFAGYLQPSAARTNPPAVLLRTTEAKQALTGMIEAHARMYDAIHAHDANGKARVGLVYPLAAVEPIDAQSALDRAGAEAFHHLYNEIFLDAVIDGRFDANLDGVIDPDPVAGELRDDLGDRMDYVGLNYYFRIRVSGLDRPFLPDLSSLTTFNPLTAQNLADHPRGLYEGIKLVSERWNRPVVVTENGWDPAEAERPDGAGLSTGEEYLARHTQWLRRAVEEGYDVGGYFYWTLTDNYEWNHGMDIRMGLYAVDEDDPEKARRARPAAAAFRRIAQAADVPADLVAAYPID